MASDAHASAIRTPVQWRVSGVTPVGWCEMVDMPRLLPVPCVAGADPPRDRIGAQARAANYCIARLKSTLLTSPHVWASS
jgi:hypothetical protein